MLAASVYIVWCSLRNRTVRRFARLRDPRYLLGAIAAVSYFTFMITRVGGGRGRRTQAAAREAATSGLASVAPGLTALPMAALAASAWLVPFDAGLLDFSKAETHLLFPAPVPRWKLLVHRLIRSQAGLLFSSILPALLIPAASPFGRVRFGVGMWLILVTGKLYFTGVALSRVRLHSPNPIARWKARIPLALSVVAISVIATPVLTELLVRPPDDIEDGLTRAGAIASSGLPAIALLPVTALTKPLFAASPDALVGLLPAAFLVFVVMLLWALRSGDVFPDAVEVAIASKEIGADTSRVRNQRSKSAWPLAAAGRPEGAFVWKAATETARTFDWRLGVILAVLAIGAILSGQEEIIRGISVMAFMGAFFLVMIAPQTYRADLRRDLEHLDLLKTWPVRGASVVRGALIWPVIALTVCAWPLMAVAFAVADAVISTLAGSTRAAAFASAAVLAPSVIALQYSIHTATALVFPGWVQIGRRRPRGLDVAGQRMVTMAMTWIVMTIALVPPALVAGLIWLALWPVVGQGAWVVAAAGGSIAVLIEVLAITEVLGPLFDRLDLTGVERAET